MTVTYSLQVSTAHLGTFVKLLARWKGSIYKLMWKEMVIFSALYYALVILYRFILPTSHQKNFENVALYCREFTDLIPITFIMGFYVSLVVTRFWGHFDSIPWIDRVAVQVVSYVHGSDERGRQIRRSLVRYANTLLLITLQNVSVKVKKRFPTSEHLVAAGILTEEEQKEYDRNPCPYSNWWLPSVWFSNLAVQARREGRIQDDMHLKALVDEILQFRGACGGLWTYDWISIPLVYTQVVTLAVYSFFVACLMGRQYIYNDTNSYLVDRYVPVFTLVQFFFYMGWLKVAEELINPLGEDEDDYDLHYIIDRNITVSYLVADFNYRQWPAIEKDMYWDQRLPDVPYTMAAEKARTVPFPGSAADVEVKISQMEWTDADTYEDALEEVPAPLPKTNGDVESSGERQPDNSDTSPSSMVEYLAQNPSLLRRLISREESNVAGWVSRTKHNSTSSSTGGNLRRRPSVVKLINNKNVTRSPQPAKDRKRSATQDKRTLSSGSETIEPAPMTKTEDGSSLVELVNLASASTNNLVEVASKENHKVPKPSLSFQRLHSLTSQRSGSTYVEPILELDEDEIHVAGSINGIDNLVFEDGESEGARKYSQTSTTSEYSYSSSPPQAMSKQFKRTEKHHPETLNLGLLTKPMSASDSSWSLPGGLTKFTLEPVSEEHEAVSPLDSQSQATSSNAIKREDTDMDHVEQMDTEDDDDIPTLLNKISDQTP